VRCVDPAGQLCALFMGRRHNLVPHVHRSVGWIRGSKSCDDYPIMVRLRPRNLTFYGHLKEEYREWVQKAHLALISVQSASNLVPSSSGTLPQLSQTTARFPGEWKQTLALARTDPPPCLLPKKTCMPIQSQSIPNISAVGNCQSKGDLPPHELWCTLG
jgi:hypothetical protein